MKGNNENNNYNVIVIVIDALRAQNMSCYGYPHRTSPFIDSLAQNGVMFKNFYSCTDFTDPSFTTIFSGRFPITHGITSHGNKINKRQINDIKQTNTRFLAELIKSNKKDMVTIGIDWLGRWHKTGFDVYGEDDIVTGKKGVFCKYKWLGEKTKSIVNHFSLDWYYTFNKLLKPMGFMCRNDAESYFDYAKTALKKHVADKNRNFYLQIHLWDVHSPYHLLPKPYVKKFDNGKQEETIVDSLSRYKSEEFKKIVKDHYLRGLKYLNEVEAHYNAAINYVDTELRKFIDFLKAEGYWENTFLIITADHGENLVVDGRYTFHGGTSNRIMRVPLIIVGPNLKRKTITEMAQHTDLTPTVLGLLGIEPGSKFDGKSLLPLLKDEEFKTKNEVFFICGLAKQRFCLLNERYKYVFSPTDKDFEHKEKVWYLHRVELYDMKNDPQERNNIVKDKPALAELMEKRMIQIVSDLRRRKERYKMDHSLLKIKRSI